ncbi:EamA family transporter RarD [Frederiksenia canicola]|uniref:Chloramphenicol-sensitive protein RarD n=1 Tax=Frederiksenia canicola TaxID=123824 RepID=A0ABX9XRQ1_9PAST|nr:EamA family transporter RarD [Frederiksenia canicola]RPE95744.1 chloramphenicol-sensitive protein RarD [Frederiksenia canicola]
MIKGILCSLLASLLFGGLYLLATFLRPLEGEDVFGFRMLVTLPFLFLAVVALGKRSEFIAFLQRIWREPKLIFALLISASLVGVQMWLFLWAPNANRAIDVSIGYLLMPITMVAVGKFVYNEYLSLTKWLAILFAVIGVASNILLTSKLSWASLLVCTGYPAYFMVRKKFGISHIHSFVVEVAMLTPIALYFISQVDLPNIQTVNPNIYFYLFLLGLMSGVALISYTIASTLVPFNMLGLLGYVEPCFMLLISFLIGERLDPNSYLLMLCLMIAVSLLILDGVLQLRKKRRRGI